MIDYRPLISMMTQVMTLGMLGPMTRGPALLAQEAKKPTIKGLQAEVAELKERIEALEGKPARKPLFGGRATPVPIIDTKTKRVYHSKFTTGRALSAEAGTTTEDKFSWYKLAAKFPDRFRDATPTEIGTAKEKGLYAQMEEE